MVSYTDCLTPRSLVLSQLLMIVRSVRKDIQELTSLFGIYDDGEGEESEETIAQLQQHFKPQPGFRATYRLIIDGKRKHLIIKVENALLECSYGTVDHADVELQLERRVLDEIINGRMTFQRAFMSGETKMKGDFKILRTLDQIFVFDM